MFDFLGFTPLLHDDTEGMLGRKPVTKRVNKTLTRIDEVLRKHHDIWEVGMWWSTEAGSTMLLFPDRWIKAVRRKLQRLWMRAWRSQRARFDWKRLERMSAILWPRTSIRHPWSGQRFAVNHPK